MISIVARRMPSAKQASEGAGNFKLVNLWLALKNWLQVRIKKTPYFKDFSWLDFLQKQLLKVRVLTMKAENKINDYMTSLRERAENQQKKDETLLDNYWRDLKMIVKTKKASPVQKNLKSAADMDGKEEKSFITEITSTMPAENKIEIKATEMAIGRVVMPETTTQKTTQQKKKHHSKKKRFRDPFQW